MKVVLANVFGVAFLIGIITITASSTAFSEEKRVFACNDFPPQKIEHPVDGLLGYDVEIINAAFQRMGQENEIQYFSWNRAKREAENGNVDGLCSCSYRPEREKDFLFTDAIGFVSTGIYTKTDYPGPKINTINDLKGKLVGVISGYNLEAELKNSGIETTGANKEKNAIRMIEANRFDYFYSFRSTTDFLLSRQNKQDTLLFHPINTSPYFVCINKKSNDAKKLQVDFNAVLKEMRNDDTIQEIMSKYR